MRVVIVDDEELARARLRRLLGAHADVELVAELGDARRALTELPTLAPELALLDIRMPRHDGFELAAALADVACSIVFVTAWSDHAVQAFDRGAADYLLKPVDGERLAVALERARERGRERARRAAPRPTVEQAAAPARLAVRDGGRFVFVAIADIDAVIARGNYVELRANGATYTLRATLSSIEASLDPGAFVRIHRSILVRVTRIVSVEPVFRGEYLVELADHTRFTSARRHRGELRRALGLP